MGPFSIIAEKSDSKELEAPFSVARKTETGRRLAYTAFR
jgi:hypothetical protein